FERLRRNLQQAFRAVAENELGLRASHRVVIVDRAPFAIKRHLVPAGLVFVHLAVLRGGDHRTRADDECGHKPQTFALHPSSTCVGITLETSTSPGEILQAAAPQGKERRGAVQRSGPRTERCISIRWSMPRVASSVI